MRNLDALFMNATDVHSLVRSVIVIFALPFAVMSVFGSSDGWQVSVRAGTGEILRFTVAGGEPDEMRLTIRKVVESER